MVLETLVLPKGSEESILIPEQALDPRDASKMTEGLPAPVRAIVIARN